MYELRLRHHFDAAHRLRHHAGKCERLHGHRWDVEVLVACEELDANGMVVDFGEVKATINSLDHGYLNEQLAMDDPTAERIANALHRALACVVRSECRVEVTVWESPEAAVTYRL